MAAATALVQSPCKIHLITDSEYVMHGLLALAFGSELQQGARNLDKWWHIEKHIHKLKEVTWLKSHCTPEQAAARGFSEVD